LEWLLALWLPNGCFSENSIRSEQGIPYLSPVENRIGWILQNCHASTQILDVVQVVLGGLTNHISAAAVELLSRRIKLSPEGIRQASCDLHHRPPELSRMSATSA